MAVSELIEKLHLGREIHYRECWSCWRFQRFHECKYRKWFEKRLFCVKKAEKVDNRLMR